MAAKKKKPTPDPLREVLGRRVCGNCRHWERYPDVSQTPGEDISGDCLLHPPKVHGYDDVDEDRARPIQSVPVVAFRHRCGQHGPQVT